MESKPLMRGTTSCFMICALLLRTLCPLLEPALTCLRMLKPSRKQKEVYCSCLTISKENYSIFCRYFSFNTSEKNMRRRTLRQKTSCDWMSKE